MRASDGDRQRDEQQLMSNRYDLRRCHEHAMGGHGEVREKEMKCIPRDVRPAARNDANR